MGKFKEGYKILSASMNRVTDVYEPGAIEWGKKHQKSLWQSITQAEKKMNQSCLQNRINDLKFDADQYETLWRKMIQLYQKSKMRCAPFCAPAGTDGDKSGKLWDLNITHGQQNYLGQAQLDGQRSFLPERVGTG